MLSGGFRGVKSGLRSRDGAGHGTFIQASRPRTRGLMRGRYPQVGGAARDAPRQDMTSKEVEAMFYALDARWMGRLLSGKRAPTAADRGGRQPPVNRLPGF